MDIASVFEWFAQESKSIAEQAAEPEQREKLAELALLWASAAQQCSGGAPSDAKPLRALLSSRPQVAAFFLGCRVQSELSTASAAAMRSWNTPIKLPEGVNASTSPTSITMMKPRRPFSEAMKVGSAMMVMPALPATGGSTTEPSATGAWAHGRCR
jgi:hypothetical protein